MQSKKVNIVFLFDVAEHFETKKIREDYRDRLCLSGVCLRASRVTEREGQDSCLSDRDLLKTAWKSRIARLLREDSPFQRPVSIPPGHVMNHSQIKSD